MRPNAPGARHPRSISYAPQSIQAVRRAEPAAPSNPAWILCREFEQLPIADDAALLVHARQGRVRASDYLVSTRLDRCVQARDIAEVDAILRSRHRLLTAAGELGERVLAPLRIALLILAALLNSTAAFTRHDWEIK